MLGAGSGWLPLLQVRSRYMNGDFQPSPGKINAKRAFCRLVGKSRNVWLFGWNSRSGGDLQPLDPLYCCLNVPSGQRPFIPAKNPATNANLKS